MLLPLKMVHEKERNCPEWFRGFSEVEDMTATTDAKSQDLVCGMDVNPSEDAWMTSYAGTDFHFCSESCLDAFKKNPAKYLKPKGFFARFLDRLARTNQLEFGQGGPGCCH
jgi:YHS domain-containing protein